MNNLKSNCFVNQLPFLVLVSLCLLVSWSAVAVAASKTDVLLQEILVTATKKSKGEALQDAPVAVTAISADQLEITRATSLESLVYSIPNTQFEGIGTARGFASFSIRGYGINSSIPSVEPAVGNFIDGVYLGVNYGVITDFLDVESIEVIRGPQGLLFGRNVTGGAVLINSKRPTDEFEASLSARLETGLDKTYTVVINGALTDNLNGRVAMYYRDDDGWFENDAPGGSSDFGATQTKMIRPSLSFQPNDYSSHTLIAEFGEVQGDGGVTHGRALYDDHDVALDEEGDTDQEWRRVSLESVWDIGFGNGTITNILGWREVDQYNLSDFDSTPFPILHFYQTLEQEQWSNELRYNGNFGNLDITSGVYYFEQEMEQRNQQTLFGFLNQIVGGNLDHSSWAVYTQGDYHVTDTFTITAGLRYTWEEKDAEVSPRDLGACFQTGPKDWECSTYLQDDETYSFVMPKVGFKWDIADDINLYGTYSKGFRSGGFNLRPATSAKDAMGNPTVAPPYDEEEQDSFELGVKGKFNDGKTTLNLAAFYSTVDGLQKDISYTVIGPGGLPETRQESANTADARMQGLEGELTQVLTDNLILNVSFGYLDAEYTDVSALGAANGITEDLELTKAPKFTSSVNLTHELYLDSTGGSIVSRLGYQHRDHTYSQDNNGDKAPPVDLFDLYITYYSASANWSLGLYGRNLTDEVVYTYTAGLPLVLFPGGTSSALNEGRTYGAEIKYNF